MRHPEPEDSPQALKTEAIEEEYVIMNRKSASVTTVVAIMGLLGVVFIVQDVEADGGIYIRADGSVEPTTASILTADNITYTFVSIIKQPITVERNGIVIDGAGLTLRNPADIPAFDINGISLCGRNNITIKNMTIRAFWMGIQLKNSNNNTVLSVAITKSYHGIRMFNSNNNKIHKNNITANYHDGIQLYSSNSNSLHGNILTNKDYAIRIEDSSHNQITENDIKQNRDGVVLIDSSHNSITRNNITENTEGLWLFNSFDNTIYRNKLVNNTQQVVNFDSQNIWDNGKKGNYWSDYEKRYPDAEKMETLGTWDTPYVIDENNKDNHPIIPEFGSFLVLLLFMTTTLLALAVDKFMHPFMRPRPSKKPVAHSKPQKGVEWS